MKVADHKNFKRISYHRTILVTFPWTHL